MLWQNSPSVHGVTPLGEKSGAKQVSPPLQSLGRKHDDPVAVGVGAMLC
jgi:hypothetical protein